MARLKDKYLNEVVPALREKLGIAVLFVKRAQNAKPRLVCDRFQQIQRFILHCVPPL